MMARMLTTTIMGLALLLAALGGCGSRQSSQAFMRPEVSLAYIQNVAVLPFEDLGGGPGPTQRTREIIITQLLSSGLFDVVDKGRLDSSLRDEAVVPGDPLDDPTMRRLGQRLGVQAFILGSVEQDTGLRGTSAYPEIIITMRLVDSEAGKVIWQASDRGSGYSVGDRLFGLAPKNSFQITVELVERMLLTLK